MGARGRKPASELTVIENGSTEIKPRATPPTRLTQDQQYVWDAVVNRLPADWFPDETLPMLTQYCRHVASGEKIARMLRSVEATDQVDLDDYDKLLKLQEREGRAISSLATRMRLTQQATYDPKKSKGKAGKRPWEA